MPHFTRREKHVTIAFFVIPILIMASGVDQQTLDRYEIPFLLFILTPLIFYMVTDKERMNKQ